MNIKLLKNYKGRKKGDIISVGIALTNTLIRNGIACLAIDRNILVKPQYSNTALASQKDKMMRSKKIK